MLGTQVYGQLDFLPGYELQERCRACSQIIYVVYVARGVEDGHGGRCCESFGPPQGRSWLPKLSCKAVDRFQFLACCVKLLDQQWILSVNQSKHQQLWHRKCVASSFPLVTGTSTSTHIFVTVTPENPRGAKCSFSILVFRCPDLGRTTDASLITFERNKGPTPDSFALLSFLVSSA